jgi:membrane-bound ClpP family serine protease
MKSQNYSNHRRFVPLYHFFTLLGTLLLLIGSIVNLVKSSGENLYNASLLVFGSLLLMLTAFYARVFALKAQDRAIRAEENFRHYVLTGKMLDSKLTARQIIGLRFAPDEEYADLASRAVTENLSENAIKKSIKNWKEDSYRV